MGRWHLQIAPDTEWVLWGYGPRIRRIMGEECTNISHIERANIRLGGGVGDLPFKLPERHPESALEPPIEYERKVAVGWRFRTNDYIHDTGWHLVDTREEALAAARAWVERSDHRADTRAVFLEALANVREDGCPIW